MVLSEKTLRKYVLNARILYAIASSLNAAPYRAYPAS